MTLGRTPIRLAGLKEAGGSEEVDKSKYRNYYWGM